MHVGHVPGDGILFFDDTDEVYNILEAAHTQTLFMYALFVIGVACNTCTYLYCIYYIHTFILQVTTYHHLVSKNLRELAVVA